MTIHTEIAAYTVTAITNPDADMAWGGAFNIKVERARLGFDLWAIRWHGRCLDNSGTWSWEPLLSSRKDDWLAANRHTLADALRLAEAAAPNLTINGVRVDQATA